MAVPQQLKFFLNSFFSGPQAPFFLAADSGHFARHGLEVHFTEGQSLAYAVSALAAGGYDVAYGDMNELVRLKAENADIAPIAVWMMHNRSPYTIAVTADGPVRTPGAAASERHRFDHGPGSPCPVAASGRTRSIGTAAKGRCRAGAAAR